MIAFTHCCFRIHTHIADEFGSSRGGRPPVGSGGQVRTIRAADSDSDSERFRPRRTDPGAISSAALGGGMIRRRARGVGSLGGGGGGGKTRRRSSSRGRRILSGWMTHRTPAPARRRAAAAAAGRTLLRRQRLFGVKRLSGCEEGCQPSRKEWGRIRTWVERFRLRSSSGSTCRNGIREWLGSCWCFLVALDVL